MRKIVLLLFLVVFVFTLGGCYFDPEISLFPEYVKMEVTPIPVQTGSLSPTVLPSMKPMATPTPLPPPSPYPAEEKSISQRVVVSYETYTQHFYDPAEGTHAILSFSCETPKVFIETNPATAERINSYFEELNRDYWSEGDLGISTQMDLETYLLSQAEDLYMSAAASGSTASQILFNRKARVLRADDAVIGFELSEYTMADTDSREKKRFWFDASTGASLTEEDLSLPEYKENTRKEAGTLSLYSLSAGRQTGEITGLITLNENGEDLVLAADGPVYDVFLKTVGFAGGFYENEPLWYCNCLEDCAVQLCTVLPEKIPDVMISYADEAGSVMQFLLSKDTSGDPVLVFPEDFKQ